MKNRLFGLMVIGLLCVFGLAQFIGELAITETRQVQGAITGMILRLFGVLVVSLFVITSIVRELNDRTLDVIIALPFSRSIYFLGKLFGFFFLSLIVALLLCVPLFLYSASFQILIWGISLVSELFIVTVLCLFCILALGNVTTAFTAVMGFYVLARSIGAIQLISRSPVLEAATPSQEFLRELVDLIAYVLPELDRFTQTEWLVYGTGSLEGLSIVVIQTLIYLVLLAAVALFDFYRKNF